MAEYVRLDLPPGTWVGDSPCQTYGTGYCCFDMHYAEPNTPAVLSIPLCKSKDGNRVTKDKAKVNCKECIEFIHS